MSVTPHRAFSDFACKPSNTFEIAVQRTAKAFTWLLQEYSSALHMWYFLEPFAEGPQQLKGDIWEEPPYNTTLVSILF